MTHMDLWMCLCSRAVANLMQIRPIVSRRRSLTITGFGTPLDEEACKARRKVIDQLYIENGKIVIPAGGFGPKCMH